MGAEARCSVRLGGTAFIEELCSRMAALSLGEPEAGPGIIFFGANNNGELARLAELRERLQRDGVILVVRLRGVQATTEAGVMAAGKAAGLVDVKVARFSDTHTAEQFVIPKAKR